MAQATDQIKPGQRVVVTQQIPQRDEVWTQEVRGVVVRFEQRQTGSWYAHAKDDKLWLDRLVIRKDDGEIVVCNIDRYTHIEVLEEAPADEPAPVQPGKAWMTADRRWAPSVALNSPAYRPKR